MNTSEPSKEAIHQAVRSAYGEVARKAGVTRHVACCDADVVPATDYSAEELASVPQGAYLGEGSGTPVRYAGLRPGEVVVDLGAGAGMDSFLAANRVGPIGYVYGFDLTPEMVARAQRNAAHGNYTNVSFERADIEHLPLAAGTADAAISNCVINLTPNKAGVFAEIFRVLRPGGRLSLSDIVLRGQHEAIRAFREQAGPDTWCACISGALRNENYLAAIRAAGFADVRVVAERPALFQPKTGVAAVAVTITASKPA